MEDYTPAKTREAIADLCHEQWSNWMKYLFSKGAYNQDGTWTMPLWAVQRWKKQMKTPYHKLSAQEQESYRAEADKFLQRIAEVEEDPKDSLEEEINGAVEDLLLALDNTLSSRKTLSNRVHANLEKISNAELLEICLNLIEDRSLRAKIRGRINDIKAKQAHAPKSFNEATERVTKLSKGDLSRYQSEAARTLKGSNTEDSFSKREMRLMGNALGIATESGEIVDLIKKGIWHRHGVSIDKFIDELGDLLWYISSICTDLELDLEEAVDQAIKGNIDKLNERFPDGFTYEASKNRKA